MREIKKLTRTIFPYLTFITLFSVPFQIRKVLFSVFENGYFHETLNVAIYLSDILIILCITCGLVVYAADFSRVFLWIKRGNHKIYKNSLFWLALFVLWQCATLFKADNTGIAIFRILKIIEMALFGSILYLFLSNFSAQGRSASGGQFPISNSYNIKNNKKTRYGLLAICSVIFAGVIQSLWAVLQFIFQKSLGLTFLKESILSPNIPGVAKIIINGHKHIRAYGGFPHPNILAGFLAVSIICTLLFLRLFKNARQYYIAAKQNISGEGSKLTLLSCNHYTKLTLVLPRSYTKVTLVLKIALVLQFIGLVLAGSISGFLALLSFGIIFILCRYEVLSRIYNEDNKKLTLLSCNDYTKLTLVLPRLYTKVTLVLIILAILSLSGGLFYLRSEDLIQNKNSIIERIDQYKISKEVISKNKNMIFGIGTGNYVDFLNKNGKAISYISTTEMQAWKKQPIHNVFVLILVENGGAGLLLFLVFFFLLVWRNPLVISLLPIMCLDHYLWTAQQGILTAVLFIVVLLFFKKFENKSALKIKEIRNWGQK